MIRMLLSFRGEKERQIQSYESMNQWKYRKTTAPRPKQYLLLYTFFLKHAYIGFCHYNMIEKNFSNLNCMYLDYQQSICRKYLPKHTLYKYEYHGCLISRTIARNVHKAVKKLASLGPFLFFSPISFGDPLFLNDPISFAFLSKLQMSGNEKKNAKFD